ncbi:hypothetical protein KAFR_0D03510 [Kazachstania africana CBS 2517]|uniref:Large ribosomal subunit protein mL50 n=1 Tax=Kazachstania africana (strain ATCC 22294 / BCRC 22015 / CBS 2517 / CECT 1963 / NBRC 1671 / NRRL Y-8276) TaxID=1071382 RepID=H2AUE9_KAZAF|nr:hypothetical protein KAFR_0D03510 [Kazachstania africana CBS 2517]CCF57999.1 hypothetical protein KAFR_0D03510 [Kazachstania africana CBS 2517]
MNLVRHQGASYVIRRSIVSTQPNYNFFAWFKDRKKQKAVHNQNVRKTEALIKDIESGTDVSKDMGSSSTRIDLVPENFVGKRQVKTISLKEVPFHNWLSKSKVKTEKDLDHHIIEAYNHAFPSAAVKAIRNGKLKAPFVDVTSKFKFSKRLQSLTGYAISDYQCTILSTPLSFKDYYMKEILSGKALRFNENEPNAIHLSKESFTSPNVHIVEDTPVKLQKRKFNEILKEVKMLEEQESHEAIERARNFDN